MDLTPVQLAILLALFGLVGGIGITAIGPGGVLPTIGMFLLTGLSPAHIAGTAIATHVATGSVGTLAYLRSGQLRQPNTRRVAVQLSLAALLGTPLGVLLNTSLPEGAFGKLLAAAVAVTGVLVWVRERRVMANATGVESHTHDLPPVTVVLVGIVVAAVGGMFGLGGPMLSVPLLVIFGLPVLSALAAAQAQSIVIASIGTIAYGLHGTIDWKLAALVGIPELAGVLIGWKIAHAIPARQLKYALAGTLLIIAPYLAWRS